MPTYTGAMPHAFRLLNVFTVAGDPFSGNPLCVVEGADDLSTAQMQQIARQMNLSETTFVLAAEGIATARVRIFTPGFEMPFAGHPTLGTAAVVGAGTDVVLELAAGLVPVTVAPDGALTLRAAKVPVTRAVDATRAEIAAMVGLPAQAIADEPRWVNTGVEQLVIPITTSAYVRAAKPVLALIEQHGFSASRDEAMAYLVAQDTPAWTVRFFFTSNGALLEDPATGSACANLGGYLIARGDARPLEVRLAQGAEISRPSRLGLRVDATDGIFVTGTVHEVGRGTLAI